MADTVEHNPTSSLRHPLFASDGNNDEVTGGLVIEGQSWMSHPPAESLASQTRPLTRCRNMVRSWTVIQKLQLNEKLAVVGLVKSDSSTFAGQGIRINAVCPGCVSLPLTVPRRFALLILV
jgi:hypothetical protein